MLDIERHWYRSSYTALSCLLMPFAVLFGLIIAVRRQFYRWHVFKISKLNVPVIVVGNITVGGTGKTPFVIGLVAFLKAHGFQPGIISRGYGGQFSKVPQFVDEQASPASVGDEAVLLAKRAQCPVVIAADRVAAANMLLQKTTCNIIISDDGLQHYRLGRDIEIVMVDHQRQFGNQLLLPAGPLREPVSRLKQIDFVVTQPALQEDYVVSVKQATIQKPLTDFQQTRVHAVAAIGNPQRFFSSLREKNIDIIEHVFPDHYLYQAHDLNFNDNLPILMTEKDAVKCTHFADARCWFVPISVQISDEWGERVLQKLKGV
jgi:tetraacyldisaccharide 4'-kinase